MGKETPKLTSEPNGEDQAHCALGGDEEEEEKRVLGQRFPKKTWLGKKKT